MGHWIPSTKSMSSDVIFFDLSRTLTEFCYGFCRVHILTINSYLPYFRWLSVDNLVLHSGLST